MPILRSLSPDLVINALVVLAMVVVVLLIIALARRVLDDRR